MLLLLLPSYSCLLHLLHFLLIKFIVRNSQFLFTPDHWDTFKTYISSGSHYISNQWQKKEIYLFQNLQTLLLYVKQANGRKRTVTNWFLVQ